MSIEAYSTKGMRKENQDAYIALELKIGGKDISVLAVCDGMGVLQMVLMHLIF